MHLTRRIMIQLGVFSVIALTAVGIIVFGYLKLPALMGVGRYTVTMELPRSGGLYPRGNVTYRGTPVGKIESVRLADNGSVRVLLSLKSGIHIPSNLKAQVHSQTAIGEQYVELLPQDTTSPPLKNGDTIALNATSVPPDVDGLLDAANRGLLAIPHDSLKTTIDESYIAFGGLGPELSRIVKGSTALASDARANLDSLTTVIDESAPVLDTQTQSGDSVRAWASHLATITGELRNHDNQLNWLLEAGGPAADQARLLVQRLQPSLPVILANLVSIGKVGIAYQNDIEQLLVLLPQGVAQGAGVGIPNRNTNLPYRGPFLDFNLNFNLPPPCTTGFLPPQQRRTPATEDDPDRPEGDLYCRVPQNSQFNVRGARNLPCETVPGKRAPTVKMCESNEQYVPLNDGFYWKGDPNATYTGQDIPQLPPGSTPRVSPPPKATSPPLVPPLAVTEYDPGTGSYIAPDGRVYTQSDLSDEHPKEKTWQQMLVPPTPN